MATAIDAEKWSDEYKDAKCSNCAKKKKDQIADYYCYDCNTHMCTSCLGSHNDWNVNHNVVKGQGDNKDVLTEKCGKHPDELITLYCRRHDKLLCKKCRLLDHRTCQDTQDIRESSDELNAIPELQAVPAQLKSALDNINIAIKVLDEHLANITKHGNGFLNDLEVYAKKLLSRIEELKEKSKKDIKSKQEELFAVARQHRQACALTKDEIDQCLDKITKSKEWKANTFVLKKKGQTIAPKVDALYKESDRLIKGHQFDFMTEMKIFDSLSCFSSLVKEVSTKAQDISSQGAVGSEADIPVQEIVRSPADCQVERLVEKRGDRSVVRPEKKLINVRIQEDKETCMSFGCCTLSDGSLMVADNKNRRLKRVDPSSSMVTKFTDTDGHPTDVCCIGPQEVAVAFPDDSTQVQVYNTVSLTRTRTVELGHGTSRIACHGGLLYCAETFGTILYVHDVRSGRKLSEIPKDTDGQKRFSKLFSSTDGRELFSDIRHIAVNSSGDRLYVTDYRRGLVCVGVDGRQIFCLSKKDLGLTGAYGVTTDHHGHVFVCGATSQNVVKVTEDGHVVGQIVSMEDGIRYPACLSYDVNRSSLYVGGGYSDHFLMVEWK